MKRVAHFRILLVLVAGLAGCASVQVAGPETLHGQRFADNVVPVAHIYADNWGYYLFKYIPLITGDPKRPGYGKKLFTNNVTVPVLADTVARKGRELGGTIITDIRSRDRSYWIAYLPIFWLNEFEVSANVSKPASGD